LINWCPSPSSYIGRQAENHRINQHEAAITIQRAWRRFILRVWRYYLSQEATKIQRVFRGFRGRRLIVKQLQARVEELNLARYNFKATEIQRMYVGIF
jgi:myosin heavy subunit